MEALAMAIKEALREIADPERAVGMAAYLKHKQAFLGVPSQGIREIVRRCAKENPPTDTAQLGGVVRELWQGEFREDRYGAIRLAERFRKLQSPELLPLYHWMIQTGQWWDLVDITASNLIGSLMREFPELSETVFGWIEDDDMWLRRTALLAQLKYKQATDRERLANMILTTAHEKEFFIRKAIGWVLREYAKTDAQWVWAFVKDHEDRLSDLSRREALKHFKATGNA